MSQVLAIASSPRIGGNSEALLDACLESVSEAGVSYEKLSICDLTIAGCTNCGGCSDTGSCVVDDDMPTLFRKFEEYPNIVISTPVFFMALPAQLKAAIDRCQAIWVRKYLLRRRMPDHDRRRGFLIQVAGMKGEKMFDGGRITIAALFGTLDYKFKDTLNLKDIDSFGAIHEHPTALDQARQMGREIVSEL
jgi:multimeric flavodoxin WrbA